MTNFVLKTVFLIFLVQEFAKQVTSSDIQGDITVKKEECSCLNTQSRLSNIMYKLFKWKPCTCGKQKNMDSSCVHGKFNETQQRCICQRCWTGKFCDKMRKENIPSFLKPSLRIHLSNDDIAGGKTIAVGKFVKNLCASDKCPCGRSKFELTGDETFAIDENTGDLKIAKNDFYPRSSEVFFRVFNEFDQENDANMTLVITTYEKDTRTESEIHSRRRRSTDTSSPLVASCVPYVVGGQYYYLPDDYIIYRVRVGYNQTSSESADLSDINVTVTVDTQYMTITGHEQHEFKTASSVVGDKAIFKITTIKQGESFFGNVTVKLLQAVKPLQQLRILCTAGATFNTIRVSKPQHSFPTLYGAFVNISTTGERPEGMELYSSSQMNIGIQLPSLMTYSVYAEIFAQSNGIPIFDLTNSLLTNDDGVTITGRSSPVLTKTRGDNVDHVAFTLSSVQATAADQFMNISLTIATTDHVQLYNNTKHYIGIGLKIGTSALTIGQAEFTIFKNEPILELLGEASAFAFTKFGINDEYNVKFEIKHNINSSKSAHNVNMYLINENTDILSSSNGSISTISKYNDSGVYTISDSSTFTSASQLPLNSKASSVVHCRVSDKEYWPFEPLYSKLILTYENEVNIKKKPIIYELPTMLYNALLINPSVVESNVITPMSIRTIDIVFSLANISKADIKFEVTLPMIETTPLMSIIKPLESFPTGSNLNMNSPINEVLTNANYSSKISSSTSSSNNNNNNNNNNNIEHNQIKLDFGLIKKSDRINTIASENEIRFRIKGCVNYHPAMSNGDQYEVTLGAVSPPYLLWAGGLQFTMTLPADPKPVLLFNFEIFNKTKDVFELLAGIELDKIMSSQGAKNISLQFYLTPYVKYKELVDKSAELTQKASTIFTAKKLSCMDSYVARIRVEIDRSACPEEGEFQFKLVTRLSYYSQDNKKYQFLRHVTRTMKNNPIFVTIPKHEKAVKDYYGRGIYARKDPTAAILEVFLCVNQHASSHKPACFLSKDLGVRWKALDSRYGSVVGYNDTGELIGVSRNQRHYLYYDVESNYYIAYMPTIPTPSGYKNLESALYVDLNDPDTQISNDHLLTIEGHQFSGAGDGLYYRPFGSGPWMRRAKWPK